MIPHLNNFKVHGKVVLFGEWAVLEGSPAIASTLSAAFQFQSQALGETARPNKLQIKSENESFMWRVWSESWPPYFRFVEAPIKHYFSSSEKFESLRPEQLSFERSWRIEEGLGSSSAAFLCSALWCRDRLNLAACAPIKLWQDLLPLLKKAQGGVGSGLDLATQIFDQSILFEAKGQHIETLPLKFPDELLLIHSGNKADTSAALKSNGAIPPKFVNLIERSVSSFLEDKDWLRALDTHYEALLEFKIIPPFVEALRTRWIQQGLVKALKTTGAGGGDGLLVWVEKNKQQEFLNSLASVGAWHSRYSWNPAMNEKLV